MRYPSATLGDVLDGVWQSFDNYDEATHVAELSPAERAELLRALTDAAKAIAGDDGTAILTSPPGGAEPAPGYKRHVSEAGVGVS